MVDEGQRARRHRLLDLRGDAGRLKQVLVQGRTRGDVGAALAHEELRVPRAAPVEADHPTVNLVPARGQAAQHQRVRGLPAQQLQVPGHLDVHGIVDVSLVAVRGDGERDEPEAGERVHARRRPLLARPRRRGRAQGAQLRGAAEAGPGDAHAAGGALRGGGRVHEGPIHRGDVLELLDLVPRRRMEEADVVARLRPLRALHAPLAA
mmetsp:Transcript_81759/g.231739  ORF Transcript_81759/g.231739 Transcript_81759/m.231739 type:complete len:207 (-) Transcript_81759:68-688(-)